MLLFYRKLPAGYKASSLPNPPGREIDDPLGWSSLRRSTAVVPLSFYRQPTVEVARQLLGCVLVHGRVAGLIVETEAYLGLSDPAAHAFRGLTPRTSVIYGPPGRAYVYFIYGMHECLNVVAEPSGSAGCVLLRALAPLCGLELMYQRRSWNGSPNGLANGPGKLTQALAVTRAHNGVRLDRGPLTIRRFHSPPEFQIGVTPRIGLTRATASPLRFIWTGHPCLSR